MYNWKVVVLQQFFLHLKLYERHSEFFVTARRRRLKTTDASVGVSYELSQPMGKTEFSSTAKIEQTLSRR